MPTRSTQHPSSSAASSPPAGAADGPSAEQLDGLVTNLMLTLTSALLDLPPGSNSNALLLTVQQQLAQPETLELLTVLLQRSNTACAELVAQACATRDCHCSSSSNSSSSGGFGISSGSSGAALPVGSRDARGCLLNMGKWPAADLPEGCGGDSSTVASQRDDDMSVDTSTNSSTGSSSNVCGSNGKDLDMHLAMVSGHFCMLAVVASMIQAYFDKDTQLKASSTYNAYLSAALTATEQAMRSAWTCAACLRAPAGQQNALRTADQAQPARKMFMAGYKLTLQLLAEVERTADSTTAAAAAAVAAAAAASASADAVTLYSQDEDNQQLRLLTSMILTTVVSLTFPPQPASSSTSTTPDSPIEPQQQQQQQQYIKGTAWFQPLADLTGCYPANIHWAAQILRDQIRWAFRMQDMTYLACEYHSIIKGRADQPVTYTWDRVSLFLPTLLFDWAASCPSEMIDYTKVVNDAAQVALTAFLQHSLAAQQLLAIYKECDACQQKSKQLGPTTTSSCSSSSSSGSSGSSGSNADGSTPALHPLLYVVQQPISVVVVSLKRELSEVNSCVKRPITDMLQALLAQLKADIHSTKRGAVADGAEPLLSCSSSSLSSLSRSSSSGGSSSSRGHHSGVGGSRADSSSSSSSSSSSGSSSSNLPGNVLLQHGRGTAAGIEFTLIVLQRLLQFTEALLCKTDDVHAANPQQPSQSLSTAAVQKYPLAVQCFRVLDALARTTKSTQAAGTGRTGRSTAGVSAGSELLWRCKGPAKQQGDSPAAGDWVPGPLMQQALAAGPGSIEQRKLISFWCSLTKVVHRTQLFTMLGAPAGVSIAPVQPPNSCTWPNVQNSWTTLALAARSVVAVLDAATATWREQYESDSSCSSSDGGSSSERNRDGGSSAGSNSGDGGSESGTGSGSCSSGANCTTDRGPHSACSRSRNSSIDGAAMKMPANPCMKEGWPCTSVSCSWSDFTASCCRVPELQQSAVNQMASGVEQQHNNMAAAATMAALFPCLAVFGRCCLLWSGLVPALMQDAFRSALTVSAIQSPQVASTTSSTVDSALEAMVAATDHITLMAQHVQQMQALVGDVLVACGMPLPDDAPATLQGQPSLLSAAGISAVDDVVLQARLQQAHTSIGAAAAAVQELARADLGNSGGVHSQGKALLDRRNRVQKDLEVLAKCFGRTVMVRGLCNNHLCSNLLGLSEGGIVKQGGAHVLWVPHSQELQQGVSGAALGAA